MAINCPFGVDPLDQSVETSVPKLSLVSYTHQDFESMKTRLIKFILERFPKDFTDFIESSLAIMEVEIFAFIADTLSFKIDQIANELYIDTVSELDNMFRLALVVGFEPTPPLPATASFSASINAVQAVDVIIPAGVLADVSVQGQQIPFEIFALDANNNPVFDEDIIIPAGSVTNTNLIGIQGQTKNDLFQGTGLTNQSFTLSQFPVLLDSIQVSADGVQWTPVDFFTDSQPRREFRVEFNSTYQAFIMFGNNQAGMMPAQGSIISVTYRVGGGAIGNVITGFINFQRQYDVQDLGFSVTVTFNNYTSGTNGYDGDSIDDIRAKLPTYIRTQQRAVTGEDYKALAETFVTPYHGQIGKATAVLRNYGCAGNVIDLFILARDGANGLITANNDLKSAFTEKLDTMKMLTDFVCLRDGIPLLVDITIDITLNKSLRKNKEEIDVRVRRQVDGFFALSNWDYGQILRNTELVKELSGISEIDAFDVTFVTNDPNNSGDIVTTKYYEIIRPDTVSINYMFV